MTKRPTARAGQCIGLLGGSFDPAHAGHVHITKQAMRRFGLDAVWWLVTPGNPLKARGPAALDLRLEEARRVIDHPRVTVTGIEEELGTRYTAETLGALLRMYPGVQFTWLMGADNLAQFHHWQDWRAILDAVRVGVIARPGERTGARVSPAARLYRGARLPGRYSRLLARSEAPAWCFINVPMTDASSTAIRARGGWKS
ncbi:MAG: nicotinate-nucleotide adenylyltransferase [Rhodobacteraceae bacterium]|nr:nicotinate-nucleotide adenylyltransferase [Paracoccaceae bacterium]